MNDPREFHIDGFLSARASGFRPEGYIADLIAPRVPVSKQSNVFATIPRNGWFTVDATGRAPGSRPNEGTYVVGSDTYFCPNYAFAHKIAWETMDNADTPFTPLQTGVEYVVTKLELDYEVRVETTVSAGVGSFSAPSDAWTNFTNSDPMADLEVAQNAIFATTGLDPNTAIIPRRVWQVLRRHPDIVQRVFPGGAGGGTVTQAQFGELIGVDRILIARTLKNTAAENATPVFTAVWSTNVTLLHVNPNPTADMVKNFMTTFLWTGPNIGTKSPGNWQVERKRDSDVMADWVRTGYYQDEKIVSAELGFQIRTGITS